jgi:hypothetical protein
MMAGNISPTFPRFLFKVRPGTRPLGGPASHRFSLSSGC